MCQGGNVFFFAVSWCLVLVPGRRRTMLRELQSRRSHQSRRATDHGRRGSSPRCMLPPRMWTFARRVGRMGGAGPGQRAAGRSPVLLAIRTFRSDVLPQLSSAHGACFLRRGQPAHLRHLGGGAGGAACAWSAAFFGGRRTRCLVWTRPPGHHAGADSLAAGFSLNNAAHRCPVLRDGCTRGRAGCGLPPRQRQWASFYDRADVLTVGANGDPRHRIPVLPGLCRSAAPATGWAPTSTCRWRRAQALRSGARPGHRPAGIAAYRADARWWWRCWNTFEGDPISGLA